MTGANTLKHYLGALLLGVGLLFMPAEKISAQSDKFLEGSGKVGSFAVDVLQDFTLDTSIDAGGTTAEDSGKARLKDFVKGKTLDYLKGKITGGDDISAGMALILNRIFDRLNQHRKRSGGRAGICELAAMNQAGSIAFDAKNLRLLRGSANIVFDLLTSTIPGAAGLAESLVTNIGAGALKELRKLAEKEIKKAWANSRNEAFKYEKSSGPCKLSMTVLWHKKKNKYLFLIKGTCGCKKVLINPPDDTHEIAMRSFEVLGGGSITPSLDVSNPKKPKIKLRAGFPNYQVNANCACTLTKIEDPPPPPEEDPRHLSETGHIKIQAQVKCKACQPKFDELNAAANSANLIADRMNVLAAKVNAEPFKTADRERNIVLWNTLASKLADLENRYDRIFIEFVQCEKTECKLDGKLRLGEKDLKRPTSTNCDKCRPIVTALNIEIEKYNSIAGQMNTLARLASKGDMQHGTVVGNKTYRKWQALHVQLKSSAGNIKGLRKEQAKCEAKFCFNVGEFNKIPYTTTECKRAGCIAIQKRMNAVEKEYNELMDRIKSGFEKYRQYLVAGGSTSSKEGAKIRRVPILETRKMKGLWDKMARLQGLLLNCQRECRTLNQESARISTGGGATPQPAGDDAGTGTTGSSTTPTSQDSIENKVIRMILAGTSCPRYCQKLYEALVKLDKRIDYLRFKVIPRWDDRRWEIKGRIRRYELYIFAYREPKLADRKSRILYPADIDILKDIDTLSLDERENKAKYYERVVIALGKQLVPVEKRLSELEAELSHAQSQLPAAYRGLLQCEKRCTKVQISDTKIRIGNDPFDPLDPLREDHTKPGGAGGGGAVVAVPTIQVLPFGGTFIPIGKMFLALPDACPGFHFHQAGGPPLACDGSTPGDPAPFVCGFGQFSAVIDIPKASCANP